MAQFDESKVINALHTEKAEVGKKYWFADNIGRLKRRVEDNDSEWVGDLKSIKEADSLCFYLEDEGRYDLLYPYEETKQRMTNIQFMEWLSKRNGFYCVGEDVYNTFYCLKKDLNNEVVKSIKIRSWDSEEWIEPTVDIYERDCKEE